MQEIILPLEYQGCLAPRDSTAAPILVFAPAGFASHATCSYPGSQPRRRSAVDHRSAPVVSCLLRRLSQDNAAYRNCPARKVEEPWRVFARNNGFPRNGQANEPADQISWMGLKAGYPTGFFLHSALSPAVYLPKVSTRTHAAAVVGLPSAAASGSLSDAAAPPMALTSSRERTVQRMSLLRGQDTGAR